MFQIPVDGLVLLVRLVYVNYSLLRTALVIAGKIMLVLCRNRSLFDVNSWKMNFAFHFIHLGLSFRDDRK